jgi:hypothetical protein
MAKDVRSFTDSCDGCGANKQWRERRRGFLKPLPIPDRLWSEISIDFIEKLPESEGCQNMIVVTDRLGKGIVADGLPDLEVETVAKWFIRRYYPHHFLPFAIVSDRGSQFTSALWTRICQMLRIKRRLSTAFSPETDGATERMNQIIEAYFRQFVSYAQDDWLQWLPLAVSAICGRVAASTGVSPFFLSHGWDQTLFEDFADKLTDRDKRNSPVARADELLRRLRDAREWAQTAMAAAQEAQERYTNRYRIQAPVFKEGDKVWLSLENIKTSRPSKKLDAKYAKFTVRKAIGSHSYELDTPPGVHNVFHSRLLRPVKEKTLPGQVVTDAHPPAQMVDGDLEYTVDEILDEKGKGSRARCLVKWTGYQEPTWEPKSALQETVALTQWEQKLQAGLRPVGKRQEAGLTRKGRKKGRKGGNVRG